QTQTTGMEKMNSVSGNNVSASYSYSFQYSNNQGLSNSSSSSGSYTWSSSVFTYVKGTDHQVGYSNPIYVWFAMNPSLPAAGTFTYTDTLYVTSTSYSLAPASPPPTDIAAVLLGLAPYFVAALVAIIFIVVIAVYASSRRRRMDTIPEHSPTPLHAPPSTPL